MSIFKEKDYWLSAGLFLLFAAYQIFAIWEYYSRQFADEAPHRVVQMIVNSVGGEFYAAVFLQILFIVFVHLLVATIAYILWNNFPSERLNKSRIYFVVYILGVILLSVLWNRILFPASLSFEASDLLLVQTQSMNVFYVLNIAYIVFFVVAFSSFVFNKVRMLRPRNKRVYVMLAAFFAVVLLIDARTNQLDATPVGGNGAPNIILIGVDSLRLDHLAYYGFKKGLTPNIDGFLEQAAVFDDTLTPIARTFPAWMSIFSGKYPVSHGARFNLYPEEEVEKSALLPAILQQLNYSTYYVTDEVRFANFTKDYGFDVLSAPKMGVLDFTFGMSLDFVYLNLLSRIKQLSALFPYTYANRAAKTIYYPNSFNDRITETINDIETAPFFMVVHHCLPHWPFFNHIDPDITETVIKKYTGTSSASSQYLNTLYLVDKQVGDLLHELKEKGALKNSIVILLSDHGESFAINNDMLIAEDDAPIPVGVGHGTFALSSVQHQVLLGMQRYKDGEAIWSAGKRKNEASLIDIMPTLVNTLSLDTKGYDGISLLPYLENESLASDFRLRFTESGLTSGSVETNNPDEAKLFKEYSKFYQITENNLVSLKPQHLNQLLKTKQRAAIKNGKGLMFRRSEQGAQWLLADYQAETVKEIDNPELFDETTKYLKAQLCEAYKIDVDFYIRVCDQS